MVIKTDLCAYTEYRIYPGRGQRFVAKDGKVSFFINSKADSLFHQRIKAVKLRWLQEVKCFCKPPVGVKITLEALCIMLEIEPVKKANEAGEEIDDYWEASVKGPLSNPRKLLETLRDYDKDHIPERVINKISPYIEREDFDPAAIKRQSQACEALCMWCRAMHKSDMLVEIVVKRSQRP